MKIPLSKIRIEKKGIYDFEKLQQVVKEWADYRQFFYNEGTYSIANSGDGKEITWNFKLARRLDNYFFLRIDVSVYTFRQIEVMVSVDGKKITMDQGYVNMHFKPELELDYRGIFEGSKFKTFLQNFYHMYIIKDKINIVIVKLIIETHGLLHAIRRSLRMNLGL